MSDHLQIIEAAFRGFASGLGLVTRDAVIVKTTTVEAGVVPVVEAGEPKPAAKPRAKKETPAPAPVVEAAQAPTPAALPEWPAELNPEPEEAPAKAKTPTWIEEAEAAVSAGKSDPNAPKTVHDYARRQLQEICTVRPDGLSIAKALIADHLGRIDGKLTDLALDALPGFLDELRAAVAAA